MKKIQKKRPVVFSKDLTPPPQVASWSFKQLVFGKKKKERKVKINQERTMILLTFSLYLT